MCYVVCVLLPCVIDFYEGSRKPSPVLVKHSLPLHIINGSHCISPTQSVVSHQVAGVCTFGDDIHAKG